MRNILTLFLFSLLFSTASMAADGYRIEVELEGFSEKEAYLAYYFGNSQYIKDTAQVTDGRFVFEGEEALSGGIYLVVMPPDNQFFQILIDENEQHFSIKANANSLVSSMAFEGAPDNTRFNDYLNYLMKRRMDVEKVQKDMESQEEGSSEYAASKAELETINEQVAEFQRKYVSDHAGTLSAALIKANIPLETPDFEGEGEEDIRTKKFFWTRDNFFANINMKDDRMLRSPVLFEKVDFFVHKMRVEHPDSISEAIDHVLGEMEPGGEAWRFFLIHYLNESAQSKIVGMDAVYVHLVNKYYATGQADWTEPDQLKKIVDNAKSLEPLLIGKSAPDIELQTKEGEKLRLHDIDAKYTILYIWRYDCGVCKKSTPDMKAFYEEFKDKGVEIYAVCFKFGEEVGGCWDYIDEKEIGNWVHVVDPFNQARVNEKYYVKSTPQLYILDKDKVILSKRIGADQLAEVMNTIITVDEAEAEEEKGK